MECGKIPGNNKAIAADGLAAYLNSKCKASASFFLITTKSRFQMKRKMDSLRTNCMQLC